MTGTVLFGGLAGTSAGSDLQDLNAVDAHTFFRLLDHWKARVWVNRGDVPTEQDELESFELLSLVPEFRRSYPTVAPGEMDRGSSIEEVWLGFQLTTRTPARCLLSEEFIEQPTGRISRKTVLAPDELIESLSRWMRRPQPRCHAMVRTGPLTGHSVMLMGVDAETDSFEFWDPWPVRSLLCAENNVVGVDAVPDESRPGLWLVTAADLKDHLAAVILPEPQWHLWQTYDEWEILWPAARALAAGKSVDEALAATPGDDYLPLPDELIADPQRQRSPEDRAFAAAQTWLSERSYDPHCVAIAAWKFGDLLKSVGQAAEAIHWYRQSAMIVQSGAVRALIAQLERDGDPDEAGYWAARSRDREEAALPSTEEIEERLAGRVTFGQQVPDWRASPAGAELRHGLDLERSGDLEMAESAYRHAMASMDGHVAAVAAHQLGILLEARGAMEESSSVYLRAATSGFFDVSPYSWAHLGRVLENIGDQAKADEADRMAVESGHFEVAARVALALGRNMMRSDRPDEARLYFERAIYSNDGASGADAAFGLGALLLSTSGDTAGAIPMFRRALASQNPTTVDLARSFLETQE